VRADEWGIEPGYHDHQGNWREAPPSTTEAIRAAMGEPGPQRHAPVLFARRGEGVGWRGEVQLEDGGSFWLGDDDVLPPDFPYGYHRTERGLLVVSPGRCWLPDGGMRTWGWAVQLYAARSRRSWGMGDLADLRSLNEWAAGLGAGMVLVNPLHASLPTAQEPSPYFPSSRCFRNPIYLRVDGERPAEAAALNERHLIDRDSVWRLKRAALEDEWARFRGRDEGEAGHFERYVVEGGAALHGYAVFCALAEVCEGPWPGWPAEYRHPSSDAVGRFAVQQVDRVRFHQWLQWRVDQQLAAAGQSLGIVQDLAIGCDPAGADAWLWQDAFALGMRVGAPPDEFNTQGQDWGLPPFDPWRLRAAAYEPFIETLRAGFRHGGGLRADHVMGWFRLFWIPEGAGPGEGTYVNYPHRELFDIVALESHRARAYVVGEDLGTIEDWMRAELAERDVLSYRLLWFEPGPPSTYPERALAAVTTHDLPTVAGMWSGADLEEQEELGLEPNVEGTNAIRRRLEEWLGLAEDAPVDDVIVGAYRLLGQAPSWLVTGTLEDALAVEERPNVPGTTDERPNWCLALPEYVEELTEDPLVLQVADALREKRSGTSP
jgi:4-alpha-glucanotransferase